MINPFDSTRNQKHHLQVVVELSDWAATDKELSKRPAITINIMNSGKEVSIVRKIGIYHVDRLSLPMIVEIVRGAILLFLKIFTLGYVNRKLGRVNKQIRQRKTCIISISINKLPYSLDPGQSFKKTITLTAQQQEVISNILKGKVLIRAFAEDESGRQFLSKEPEKTTCL